MLDLLVALVADGEAARDGVDVKLFDRCAHSYSYQAPAYYAACAAGVVALALAHHQRMRFARSPP